MNAATPALVRKRAGHRCEYCRLHEDDADFLSFHIEHVIAKQHGGSDDPDFLCLAWRGMQLGQRPQPIGTFRGKALPAVQPAKTELEPAFPLGTYAPHRQDVFR